eukprot:1157901-Pelagomonas_calceolata.AAC.5
MPQRLTVAGEAAARSWTSKIMFIRPCMAMISPAKPPSIAHNLKNALRHNGLAKRDCYDLDDMSEPRDFTTLTYAPVQLSEAAAMRLALTFPTVIHCFIAWLQNNLQPCATHPSSGTASCCHPALCSCFQSRSHPRGHQRSATCGQARCRGQHCGRGQPRCHPSTPWTLHPPARGNIMQVRIRIVMRQCSRLTMVKIACDANPWMAPCA